MQYSKCQCGKAERWCSGYPIRDCEGCEECGTTLAFGPDGHRPLKPHDWQKVEEVKLVDGVEQKRTAHERCTVCQAIRKPLLPSAPPRPTKRTEVA